MSINLLLKFNDDTKRADFTLMNDIDVVQSVCNATLEEADAVAVAYKAVRHLHDGSAFFPWPIAYTELYKRRHEAEGERGIQKADENGNIVIEGGMTAAEVDALNAQTVKDNKATAQANAPEQNPAPSPPQAENEG